jgi:hypothetical protein
MSGSLDTTPYIEQSRLALCPVAEMVPIIKSVTEIGLLIFAERKKSAK